MLLSLEKIWRISSHSVWTVRNCPLAKMSMRAVTAERLMSDCALLDPGGLEQDDIESLDCRLRNLRPPVAARRLHAKASRSGSVGLGRFQCSIYTNKMFA
ncbi:unnamed protein product [Effrenium voratum]|nr:unnamed protein product [Effrenium voratum]